MHGAFAYPELFCRGSHRGVVLYDICSQNNTSFLVFIVF